VIVNGLELLPAEFVAVTV
jgi:hypothetical protein